MAKEKEIKEIREIKSKIFEQKRQLIIKIPLEIVEDFRIDPNRNDFGWAIVENEDGKVTINGRFIYKTPNEKEN